MNIDNVEYSLATSLDMRDISTRALFVVGWLDAIVHDRGSEEVLQRHEETRLEETAETDTETEGRCPL